MKLNEEVKTIVISIINIRLKINETEAPLPPNSGTEINRAIIKFFKEMKNVRKIIKFLCSEKIICLKAFTGSSIINRIVFQRSIFTTLSLR